MKSLCDFYTFIYFHRVSLQNARKRNNPNIYENLQRMQTIKRTDNNGVRLVPIPEIEVLPSGSTWVGVPPLENTKHRYPWICSLRSVGQQPYHICGVTLLSRPPGPTVLVTSAHCVYICKSEEGRLVPNCCCPNVGPGLCTDTEDCGTNATTVEMTGAEAEVICGEWDTATDTEEDYNVILPILNITVHPDFSISRGEQNSQFVADDIATIHVNDENFEQQSQTYKIYPACLPSNEPLSNVGIHSGWSKPPPPGLCDNQCSYVSRFLWEFFKAVALRHEDCKM